MPSAVTDKLTTPCPRCGKEFTIRIRRKGSFERLISLFYFYPFGCQLCGLRFIAFKWRVNYTRQPIDRRQYQRIEVSLATSFKTADDSGEALVVDLSAGGCRVKTDFGFVEDSLVDLELCLPNNEIKLHIETAIVRAVGTEYIGFEFLRVDPAAREILGDFILHQLDHSD